MRVKTSGAEHPRTRSGSFGIHSSAIANVRHATGMLTPNTARQPNQPTSSPPMAGPIARVAAATIAKPPRTLCGGESSPTSVDRRRISSIADG